MNDTFEHNGVRIFRYQDGTFGFGNVRPFTKSDLATIAAFVSNRAGTEEGQRDARRDVLAALEIIPTATSE